MLCVEVHIVFFVTIFSKRNTAAAAVANFEVFKNPALAPMWSNQTILISCRRCPGSSAVTDFKTAYGNIVEPILIRHKTIAACKDFNLFFVWVEAFEVTVENCVTAFFDFFCLCVYYVFCGRNRNCSVIIILENWCFTFLFAEPFVFRFFWKIVKSN